MLRRRKGNRKIIESKKCFWRNNPKHVTRCVKNIKSIVIWDSETDSGLTEVVLHPSTSNIRKIGSSSEVILKIANNVLI